MTRAWPDMVPRAMVSRYRCARDGGQRKAERRIGRDRELASIFKAEGAGPRNDAEFAKSSFANFFLGFFAGSATTCLPFETLLHHGRTIARISSADPGKPSRCRDGEGMRPPPFVCPRADCVARVAGNRRTTADRPELTKLFRKNDCIFVQLKYAADKQPYSRRREGKFPVSIVACRLGSKRRAI